MNCEQNGRQLFARNTAKAFVLQSIARRRTSFQRHSASTKTATSRVLLLAPVKVLVSVFNPDRLEMHCYLKWRSVSQGRVEADIVDALSSKWILVLSQTNI